MDLTLWMKSKNRKDKAVYFNSFLSSEVKGKALTSLLVYDMFAKILFGEEYAHDGFVRYDVVVVMRDAFLRNAQRKGGRAR